MENLLNEVNALRRTIESKSAAIIILRNELQECQQARDKFRNLAERQSMPRPKLTSNAIFRAEESGSALRGNAKSALAEILSQTKEENKRLRQEVNEIRCRLHDAHADLKVLRDEKIAKTGATKLRSTNLPSAQLAEQERRDLIGQLETVSVTCADLEKDIRGLLEEKEELVSERDETKGKLHRLNYILNGHLSRQENLTRIIDIDSLISENRYLQTRMKHFQDKVAKISADANTKSLVPKRRFFNRSKTMMPGGGILSDRRDSLTDDNEMNRGDHSNMKSLPHKFIDSLKQKSDIIDSLKKANGMLSKPVVELEHPVASSGEQTSPKERNSDSVTELLMAGYNPHS